MSVAEKLLQIKAEIPENVRLVAVSKFHPAEMIMEAYDAGQRIFGENHAQEIKEKQKILPNDIEWHFIGPLQTNKVKMIAPFISMIESVDSIRLLAEISKQAVHFNRTIPILLEIHIAKEEAKHGFTCDEACELLKKPLEFPNIHVRGLMGMATLTNDEAEIAAEFKQLSGLFNELKSTVFSNDSTFDTLSMGMSDDYKIAIAQGSNTVRIGTAIFGERQY